MMLTTLAAGSDLMSHVLPREIFRIGGFVVTNHILMTVVAAALVLVTFAYVARRVRPGGSGVEAYVTKGRLAQTCEVICQYFRDEVARPALGKVTDRYIGFIWTTFFFILFCNLLGMVPIGPIARFIAAAAGSAHPAHFEHLGGTATGNISVTAGLAAVAFLAIHVVGIREQGLRYFLHFNPGPWYMAPLLVPLEILGALVKPFALCVRLFANMVAGHLVLAALLGLIFLAGQVSSLMGYAVVGPSLLGSAALSLLELFVAFLQAYIFTFLTILFIAAGAVHEHEHGEDEHESQGAHGTLGAAH
jgi:F-type H+-transporting ATPase subunit a